jgi:hypothetical protein
MVQCPICGSAAQRFGHRWHCLDCNRFFAIGRRWKIVRQAKEKRFVVSETLLKLLLSELTQVRVVCRGTVKITDGKETREIPCAGVFEMPLERLATAFRANPQLADWACPFCRQEYHLSNQRGGHIDPFEPFVKAVADLNALSDRFGIEFVVKQKD